MKRIKIFVLILLLVFSLHSLTFANEAVLRKVLENGLIVLVKESPPKDLVTISVTVKAAPLYEEGYLGSGISHFVEHMLFKGTAARKPGDIEKAVRSYGGLIYGGVSSDSTSYQLTVSPKYFSDALSLLKDMLLNASFDRSELEKEREVVLKEVKLNQDDPGKKIILSLFANAYIRHPYKYPAIGFEGLLKALTRDDLIKYYKARYVPNNIVITVVGGVDRREILSKIEKEFADFRPPDYRPANIGEGEPAQIGKKMFEVEEASVLSYLAFGFHSTSILNRDLFAMDVLSMILGRGDESRLNKVLVKEKRAAHSVSASNYTPQDPGLFIISALLDKDNIEKNEKLILEEIEKIKGGDITDKELETAKRMVSSDYILSRETIEEQAKDLSESEAMTGNYDFSSRYLEGISKVTKFDVRRVASQYLNKDNLTEVMLVPKDGARLSEITIPRALVEERFEKKVLLNGLTVLARRDTKIPAASITAVFSGGLSVEDKNNSGISNFAAKMLLDGTSKRKESEIRGAVENRGGEVTSFSGLNSFGLNIIVLKGDVDFALELISDIIKNSVFPQEEIDKEKSLAMAMIKEEDDDIFQRGALLLRKSLFKGHPYGMRYIGEPETVHAFKIDDLMNFYHRYCVPNNTVISISGDIEPGKIFQKVDSLFKDEARREIPKVPAPTAEKDTVRTQTFRMDKEETLLMVGFKTAGISNPDRYPLDVLNTLLSGMSGRLFASIRGRSGLAYTLGCAQKFGLDSGFMLFYVATTKNNLETARKMLFEEIKLIKEKPVTDEELAAAKRELSSNFKISMQTNASYSFQGALDELYGLGYGNLYKYEEEIGKVSKEDIKRVADKYLNLSAYSEVVIEPD